MNLAQNGTIISVKEIARRTIEVAIKVPDDFSFRAGQYIWLMIPELKYLDPAGNTRMWSIVSSPNRKGELGIIFRTGKSGYKKTLIEMMPGTKIIFSGPYGQMKLPEDKSKPLVFLAGGVGIAPFLSMIRFSTETAFGHRITLVYANDSKKEAVYADELTRIADENHNFRLIKVFGQLGKETFKQLLDANAGAKPIWHVIGPKGFVNGVSKFLTDAGMPLRDVVFEQNYPDTDAGLAFKKNIEFSTHSPKYPFRIAVENAFFHIVITDTNGQILYANKGAQNMTGYSFEEMKGNTPRLWGGLMPGNFYREFWNTKKEKRHTFSREVKNRRKNQDIYYALMHVSPILDENQELVGFIATEEDRVRLKELEIAKSERRNLRKLFWALSGSIFVVELLIMFASEYFFRFSHLAAIFFDATILTIIIYLIYSFSSRPILKEINSRRAAEKALEMSESRYRKIFEFSMDGIILADSQGRIITTNEVAQKLLGRTAGELAGLHMRETYPLKDRPLFNQRFAEFQIKGQLRVERELLQQDGTIIFVDIFANRLPDEQALLFMRDITERKKGEQRLLEIDKAKDEFISIASHQLRSPVSGLNWILEAMQINSQNLTQKQKEYLDALSVQSKRLIALVEDLLNFSRIQLKAKVMSEKRRIKMPDFVEGFIKEIEPYAASKRHSIIVNKKFTGPLIVEINEKALYNILQNLTSNAVDYSPANTAVTVNLEKTINSIRISISNKGPAIPREEQVHLFQKFYRGESVKKMKAEGTGLGLFIVKTIIEGLGGSVGFRSEEGEDTVFWFTVPIGATDKS